MCQQYLEMQRCFLSKAPIKILDQLGAACVPIAIPLIYLKHFLLTIIQSQYQYHHCFISFDGCAVFHCGVCECIFECFNAFFHCGVCECIFECFNAVFYCGVCECIFDALTLSFIVVFVNAFPSALTLSFIVVFCECIFECFNAVFMWVLV